MQGTNLEQAFRNAFDEFADELFRHALYRLSDREKALDLVQDTFVRAWEYARTGTEIENLRAFLYRTMRNLIIDEYRRKKAVSLDAMAEEEGATPLPSDEDALGAAVDRLDAERALALVSTLPEQHAEVVLLRFMDGLSIPEIADRIGASENLVSVRIHRALKTLHDRFDDPTFTP
jgi:RNA polymerase sigma-70 factor (ECF subfamily)